MVLRLSLAVLLAASIAGCAGMAWQRPGTTQAVHDEDLEQCRQEAHLQARQETPPSLLSPLTIAPAPHGRGAVIQPNARDAERSRIEFDLTHSCMHGKGYQLVPARSGDS